MRRASRNATRFATTAAFFATLPLATHGRALPATVTAHTLPGLRVPVVRITRAATGTAPGYVFVAEKQGGKTGGPMIVDNRGRVVWYHQISPPIQATDFRSSGTAAARC